MKWYRGLLSFQRYLLRQDRYVTVPASIPALCLLASTSTTTSKSVAFPYHFQHGRKQIRRVMRKIQSSYSVQWIDHDHRKYVALAWSRGKQDCREQMRVGETANFVERLSRFDQDCLKSSVLLPSSSPRMIKRLPSSAHP